LTSYYIYDKFVVLEGVTAHKRNPCRQNGLCPGLDDFYKIV